MPGFQDARDAPSKVLCEYDGKLLTVRYVDAPTKDRIPLGKRVALHTSRLAPVKGKMAATAAPATGRQGALHEEGAFSYAPACQCGVGWDPPH